MAAQQDGWRHIVIEKPFGRDLASARELNRAQNILFLVAGSGKAEIVRAVFQGPEGYYPAQLIRPQAGQVLWMIDAPSARLLGEGK